MSLASSNKPPFVLVHGAWQGAWVWERVVDALRAAGHRVYAPSLTGIGEHAHLAGPQVTLDTHIADVVGVIEHYELDNVVLCGHSYGGMVVGGAADRVANKIGSLVYLDAFIPEAGKSLWDFLPPEGVAAQRGSAKDGWRIPRISAAEFRVVSPDDIARLDRRAVDQPIATMDQKSAVTGAWKTIPHLAYIRAAGQPRGTFAPFAEAVKRDPKWQYFEVPCGHNVMLDLPEALTGMLLGCAARATQGKR
jgi:pimeloyl-ACP methyl ester carboxylesterase